MIVAARWVIRRFEVPQTLGATLQIGLILYNTQGQTRQPEPLARTSAADPRQFWGGHSHRMWSPFGAASTSVPPPASLREPEGRNCASAAAQAVLWVLYPVFPPRGLLTDPNQPLL